MRGDADKMADIKLLDKAFHSVMQHFVDTGRAPHYTDLAKEFGLAMEEGRQLLHELIDTGIPAWLHPGTEDVVSFAPFNSMPTMYRVTVDGRQSWFAQ